MAVVERTLYLSADGTECSSIRNARYRDRCQAIGRIGDYFRTDRHGYIARLPDVAMDPDRLDTWLDEVFAMLRQIRAANHRCREAEKIK